MPTITKSQLSTRVEELTRELHTLRAANSETFANVSKLIEENNRLKAEAVKNGCPQPPAVTPVSRTERLIANLPKYTPHSKVVCSVHGPVRANKHGVCPVCFCIAAGRRQN